MGKLIIEGSFVALITPFNRDGKIDYDGFRTLIEFQSTNGTSAVLIMGSTGEVSALSVEERHEIISKTMKFKKNEMLQLYGCTSNTTQGTIDMVRFFVIAGIGKGLAHMFRWCNIAGSPSPKLITSFPSSFILVRMRFMAVPK